MVNHTNKNILEDLFLNNEYSSYAFVKKNYTNLMTIVQMYFLCMALMEICLQHLIQKEAAIAAIMQSGLKYMSLH